MSSGSCGGDHVDAVNIYDVSSHLPTRALYFWASTTYHNRATSSPAEYPHQDRREIKLNRRGWLNWRAQILGIKRALRTPIERLFNVRIVRPSEIALLFEVDHLRRFFARFKIDCIFDVGANAGQYASMLRSRVGYRGPIISFEPNPDVALILREKALHDPRWFIEELALGSRAEVAKFNVTVESELCSLHHPQIKETDLFVTAAAISRTIDVTVSTLETELPKYRNKLRFKRPFLKMDTQGHDVDVAAGAGQMLNEFVGIQSELAIKRIYADTETYDQALKFYTERGFVLSALVPNNTGFFPHLIEIDCILFNKAAQMQG